MREPPSLAPSNVVNSAGRLNSDSFLPRLFMRNTSPPSVAMKSSGENAHGSKHFTFETWRMLERLSGPDFAERMLRNPPCSIIPWPGESMRTMSSEPGMGLASMYTLLGYVLPCRIWCCVPSGFIVQR